MSDLSSILIQTQLTWSHIAITRRSTRADLRMPSDTLGGVMTLKLVVFGFGSSDIFDTALISSTEASFGWTGVASIPWSLYHRRTWENTDWFHVRFPNFQAKKDVKS